MATSLRIETLDRSGRWYLTPGSRSIYDLRVCNEAKDIADCSIVIEDPDSGVTVDPPAFKLRGNEVRTVTVLFSENAHPTRSQRVLMKLRDTSGADVAIFEHPLLMAGSTDCNITLSFKDVIVESGELKGFTLSCGLRSQSEGPAAFQVNWSAHPALLVSDIPSIALEPGEAGEVTIPVRWDRSVKDGAGLNHPQILEVGIAVSNGKRTARLRWESIEPKLDPSAWKNAYTDTKSSASTQILLLADQSAVKFLPNPAVAAPSAVATNGVVRKESAQPNLPIAAAASAEVVELLLFPELKPASAEAAPAAPAPTVQAQATQTAPPPNAPALVSQAQQPAAPRLTPYTPVRWDTMADAVVGPPKQTKPIEDQAPVVSPAKVTATVIRTRPAASVEGKKRLPIGVIVGGAAAIGAIALAAVLFKPNSSATSKAPAASSVAVTTVAPATLTQPGVPQITKHITVRAAQAKQKPVVATPAAHATATPQPTPAPTQAPQTPRPQTPRPTSRPAAAAAAHRAPLRTAPVVRPQPPEAVSQSVVALGGIEAFYGPRGHAVRVYWSAAEQASASVELIDERGAVVSATTVRGGRQNALLYLPRRFRGPLTVQVSSQGRLGERVAETTSLPSFGY